MDKYSKNFLFLSDYASFSEGKLNVLGIFENIHVKDLPGSILKCVLVGNFSIKTTEAKDIQIEVKLVDPNGKAISLQIPLIKLSLPKNQNEKRVMNFMLELGNLKFEIQGKYKFMVYINSEHAADYDFTVNKIKSNTKVN